MIEPLVFNGVCIASAAVFGYNLASQGTPEIGRGPSIALRTFSEIDEEYRKNAKFRILFGLFLVALCGYAIFRASGQGPDNDNRWILALQIAALYFGLLTGSFVACLIALTRYFVFVKTFPILNLPRPGLKLIFSPIQAYLPPIALLGSSFLDPNRYGYGGPLLVCLFWWAVSTYIATCLSSQSDEETSPESELGIQISEVTRQFEYEPARSGIIHHYTPSAVAAENGDVFVTSSLLTLCDAKEVQALVAHELSHAKDQDAKRYHDDENNSFSALVIIVVAIMVPLLLNRINEFLVLPIILILTNLIFLPSRWFILLRRAQEREFKCDEAARVLGYGPSLASGLAKVHAYSGIPSAWTFIDSFLVATPSLSARQERLLRPIEPIQDPVSATKTSDY